MNLTKAPQLTVLHRKERFLYLTIATSENIRCNKLNFFLKSVTLILCVTRFSQYITKRLVDFIDLINFPSTQDVKVNDEVQVAPQEVKLKLRPGEWTC